MTKNFRGILLSILIGLGAVLLSQLTDSSFADPLLVAMVAGLLTRLFLGSKKGFLDASLSNSYAFITLGIFLYAFVNLNLISVSQLGGSVSIVLFTVVMVYFMVTILMGKWLGQRREITYLTATGSAVCGASAIAMTAEPIKAQPEDVSISLIAVAVAALLGVFLILPIMGLMHGMDNAEYGLLSGATIQFTGFVKASLQEMHLIKINWDPQRVLAVSLSVKASRYLVLLIAIPVFSSLAARRPVFPKALWLFLAGGILGSWLRFHMPNLYAQTLVLWIRPIYRILWATALASIGLEVDLYCLLSEEGMKALVMAVTAFMIAALIFMLGVHLISGGHPHLPVNGGLV